MTSRLVADGERPICSARSATVSVSVPSIAYSAASCVKPRPSSPSCAAKPTTRSRHSARPMAMRSDSSRGFWIWSRAATTAGLERRVVVRRSVQSEMRA